MFIQILLMELEIFQFKRKDRHFKFELLLGNIKYTLPMEENEEKLW